MLALEIVDKLCDAIGESIDLITEFANLRVKQSADLIREDICESICSCLAVENTRWVLRDFF